MSFLDLVKKRYSVRAYKPDPVPDEVLNHVLEAARLAPTAANKQPFTILVAHTAGREEELGRIFKPAWFVQAPIILCVCAHKAQAWVRKSDSFSTDAVDSAIIMDHITLAATDLGLGTCWIAAFSPTTARQVFGLPEGVDPMLLTPLGYAADKPGDKIRKPMDEIVRYEKW